MATPDRTHDAGVHRFPSVEQITRDAQAYEYNALVGIKYWLRSAGTLLKQVSAHHGLDVSHADSTLGGGDI
jgi:hypothetical protein